MFVGPESRFASYIGNDSGRAVVRESVAAREGHMLVLYPKGTRTSNPPVNSFKPGITLIAKLADVPSQTVLTRGESPYLLKRAAAFHTNSWRDGRGTVELY